MKKVLFVANSGGHLSELLQLKELFNEYDYHLVTEKNDTTLYLKEKYKVIYLLSGTRSKLISFGFKFIFNIFKSFYIFIKIRPKVLVTTGTHSAVPLCYICKLFKRKVVFIETFANINSKSLSGKLVYPIADLFVVQWESMKKLYPKAEYWGWIY